MCVNFIHDCSERIKKPEMFWKIRMKKEAFTNVKVENKAMRLCLAMADFQEPGFDSIFSVVS